MERQHRARLREILNTRFNEDELRTLCFDLGIDYDDLAGESKTGKARELVAHFERHGRVPDLLDKIKRERPDLQLVETIAASFEPQRHPPLQQARIFIGYKRHSGPDEKLATYLYEFLTDQGHTVFIDQTIRAGVDWLQEIDQQIKASDFLVALLSKDSADSEMLQSEVNRAYEYRREQGHPQTLPVRLAYQGLLPYAIAAFLNPLQYVAWESEADNERVAQEIQAAIAGQLPERAPIQVAHGAGELTISEDGRPIADAQALDRPLPGFDPRFLVEELAAPGGTVKLRDKLYVERAADAHLKRQIVRPGAMTTIRASRQTGKSSLLVRGMQHARQQGARIVDVDVQRVDQDHLETPDLFLRYLLDCIVHRLRLDPGEAEKAWGSTLGPQDKLTYLLEDYILPHSAGPIVLAMDEVDRLLGTPFHSDFFALVRSWHNSAAYDERWDQLNVVMVISTEPHLLIADLNQSPFNVGLKLYLEDFDEGQVRDLNRRHGAPLTERDLAPFMELLNGHPYLTRKALYTLVTQGWGWEDLARTAPEDHGPFADHMRRYHWLLRDKPDLREALKQVIQRQRCIDELAFFRLLRAGLVKGSGEVCRCRCGLYRTYFKDKL